MARPNLSYLKNLILFLVGLPCGLLTGLTAIGNGIVAAPAVRYLLGLKAERAIGTALVVTFFAALASLLSYAQTGHIRGALIAPLFLGQVAGTALAGRIALTAFARARLLWAALLVLGGLAMVLHGWNVSHHGARIGSLLPGVPFHSIGFWFAALAVAALISAAALMIEAGGLLLVPAQIYLLNQSPLDAQGAALAVLVIGAAFGALLQVGRGNVEPQSASWMSLGSIFGGLTGAFYATRLLSHSPALALALYGFFLAGVGLVLFWRHDASPTFPSAAS